METIFTSLALCMGMCWSAGDSLQKGPVMQTWDNFSWWRHEMETFSALLAICAGNSPVPGEFPAQRPVMQSFDVFFDLRLNKRLRKQQWGWWFETPSSPLWHHCDGCWFKQALYQTIKHQTYHQLYYLNCCWLQCGPSSATAQYPSCT